MWHIDRQLPLAMCFAAAGSTGQSSFGRGCYSYYANDGNLSGKGRPDSPVPPHWGFPPNSRFTCTNPGPNPFCKRVPLLP